MCSSNVVCFSDAKKVCTSEDVKLHSVIKVHESFLRVPWITGFYVSSLDECSEKCIENRQCVAAETMVHTGGYRFCSLFSSSYGLEKRNYTGFSTIVLTCGEYLTHIQV